MGSSSQEHYDTSQAINAIVKLTYEEFSIVLTQIKPCLNSRPMIPLNVANDNGKQALTPGHFLIRQLLMALKSMELFLPIGLLPE